MTSNTLRLTSPNFWTRLAPKYARSKIGDMGSYEATLERTRQHLTATDRVLEIGAGTGATAILLAPSVGHYTASDYAPGMVSIGRERAWDASLKNLDMVCGTLGDEALGSGPYDAVLAFNLLHLLPDLPDRLAQVHGLLPQGGLFISKTPCLNGPKALFFKAMIRVMQAVGKAPFVRFLGPEDLHRAVAAAGFEVLEQDTYGARSSYLVARKP